MCASSHCFPRYVQGLCGTQGLYARLFAGEVGSPRLLDLFDKLGIKTTWFIPGHSAETFPEQMRDVARRGHEIGIHGYTHENPIAMTPQQEEDVLVKSIELIEKLSGQAPRGYVAPWWEMSGSTAALLKHTIKSDAKQFIVATESGVIHEMRKQSPDKEFIPAPPNDSTCACNECNFMRLNTMEKLYNCLKYELPEIFVDEQVQEKAIRPIKKMLEISERLGL